MPWPISSLGSRIRSWVRDYDCLQFVAVIFIYIQIGCSLIGSLGAMFNGLQLINLVVSLFALVAIESSSQSLGRTYAVLLFFSIMLDVAWFILFARTIWNISSDQIFGSHFVFSLKLALLMQITGFSVRFLSSLLWIQMYRLGVSTVDSTNLRAADYNIRNSLLSSSPREIARENSMATDIMSTSIQIARENSLATDILSGSIYDPAHYSSLFEESHDKEFTPKRKKHLDGHSASVIESPYFRSGLRSLKIIDEIGNYLKQYFSSYVEGNVAMDGIKEVIMKVESSPRTLN